MIDFELAGINAFKKEFPDIAITGCSFHFGDAQVRWLNGTFLNKNIKSVCSGVAISEILVRLKGGTFFGRFFIAYLSYLRKRPLTVW